MQDLNDKITGNSLTAAEWNEQPSEIQNVIEGLGLVLSGADLNQVGKAIVELVAHGDFYTDSGAADAYVLSAGGLKQDPVGYTDGMRIRWRPIANNTGASTVNVATLGVKNIFYAGAALDADRLILGETVTAEYNTSDGRFNLVLTSDTGNYKVNGYSLQVANYKSSSPTVTSEDGTPRGVFFKPDGLSMYITGRASAAVYQYTLSTAWDVSTASYASKSASISAQDGSPNGLFFKPDGLSMYVAGPTTSGTIYQYTLSTAWDVSTASYASKSASVNAEDADPESVFFKPDGLSMYITGNISDTAYQYTLSTAWDVSTASYASKSVNVSSQDVIPYGISFKNDGVVMFIAGASNDVIYQYSLSTAWDISTATYSGISFNVSSQDSSISDIFFKNDGKYMFVVGFSNDSVHQYTTNFISL